MISEGEDILFAMEVSFAEQYAVFGDPEQMHNHYPWTLKR